MFALTEKAQALFAQRCDAITPTLEYHGLHMSQVLLVGGAALAKQGIDTHVPTVSDPFDVDLIAPSAVLERYTAIGKAIDYTIPAEDGRLKLTALRAEYNVMDMSGSRSSTFMLGRAAMTGRCLSARPSDVASHKLFRGEPKDVIGLLQGHIVASAHGNPAVEDPDWISQLRYALTDLPEALEQLAEAPRWAQRIAVKPSRSEYAAIRMLT